MSKENENRIYSPEEEAAIIQYLKQADQYKNAVVIGQAFAEIARTFGKFSYLEMERMFRSFNSDTFLIAVPFNLQNEFQCKDMVSKEEMPYYLWICVNGGEEAQQKLAEIEISPEENNNRLSITGMLTTKPGTNFSRISKANLN